MPAKDEGATVSAFRDPQDTFRCPLLVAGLSKDDARRASESCHVECRFRIRGRCGCRIVDIRPTGAGRRSA